MEPVLDWGPGFVTQGTSAWLRPKLHLLSGLVSPAGLGQILSPHLTWWSPS